MKYEIANVTLLVHDEIVIEAPALEVSEELFWKILTALIRAEAETPLHAFVRYHSGISSTELLTKPEGLVVGMIWFKITE